MVYAAGVEDVHRFAAEQFAEATLVDYVRYQVQQARTPSAHNINLRSSIVRRLFRSYFGQEMPHGPFRLQQSYSRRSPLGCGRTRIIVVDEVLRVKVPQRVVVPLSVEEVARFWASFRTARDLAIVALMLLNGLRSREVIAIQLQDLSFSESLLRVRGKGRRWRALPLPPETIRILECICVRSGPSPPRPTCSYV